MRADGVAGFVDAGGEGVGKEGFLRGVAREEVGFEDDLVVVEAGEAAELLVCRQGVGEEYGVDAERDEVAGGEARRQGAVVFECWEAVSKRGAAAAVPGGEEGADADAGFVEYGGLAREGFLAESGAGARVEVVEGVDLGEVGLGIYEFLEQAAGHGGGVELETDVLAVVAEAGDVLAGEAVVEAQRGDAEHAEGGEVEFLEAEQGEGGGADVGDDLHVMSARGLEQDAELALEGAGVGLGDVEGGEEAREAEGGGCLDEGEVFRQRVVEAGVDGNAILHEINSFDEGKMGRSGGSGSRWFLGSRLGADGGCRATRSALRSRRHEGLVVGGGSSCLRIGSALRSLPGARRPRLVGVAGE